jgi:hypothetical protein
MQKKKAVWRAIITQIQTASNGLLYLCYRCRVLATIGLYFFLFQQVIYIQVTLKRPIYLSPMPDAQNSNEVFLIIDGIDYPVVTLPYTPQAGTFNLFDASRPWCLCQVFYSFNNRFKVGLGQFIQCLLHRPSKLDPVDRFDWINFTAIQGKPLETSCLQHRLKMTTLQTRQSHPPAWLL